MSCKKAFDIMASAYGGFDVFDPDMFRIAWVNDYDLAKDFVLKVMKGRLKEDPYS